MTRRALLVGGLGCAAAVVGAGVGVERDLLPGRTWLHSQLGINGTPGGVPDIGTGQLVSGSFTSRDRLAISVGWSVAYPPGVSSDIQLPVLVVLHGRATDHRMAFSRDYLALDRFLASSVADGGPRFAIASVDGGDTYWHRRRSGEDAGAMVTDEFLPLLAERGLDTAKVAFLGWSMGGYGSLLLAGRLGPGRVAAVVAESPALWRHADETPQGAFDDRADFEAHTVFGREGQLAGIPLRIDCGTGDPFFYRVTREYVAGLRQRPAGGFQPGGHDLGYWRRMAPAQLAFVGPHLAGSA